MSQTELYIGDILSSLRAIKGFTIKELSKGICSEEDLIFFENEKKSPTIQQLHELAKRLNVDLSYFFDLVSNSKQNYTKSIQELINKYKRERDYKAISNIIKKEINNPLFQYTNLKQFLLWHEGICIYYLDSEKEKSIEYLREAIKITNPKLESLTEREIEILTSIGIIQYECAEFENSAKTLTEAYYSLEDLPNLVDAKVKPKVLFGLSQSLSELKKYEESLYYSKKGIDFCINKEILYLFAELHYQTGENYIKVGNIGTGKEYIEDSIKILKLQGNEKFAQIFQTELEKLLETN